MWTFGGVIATVPGLAWGGICPRFSLCMTEKEVESRGAGSLQRPCAWSVNLVSGSVDAVD